MALLQSTTSCPSSDPVVETFTLKTVYNDALREVTELHERGKLSDEYYDTIVNTKNTDDLLAPLKTKLEARKDIAPIVQSALARLKRYGGCIDMLAQTMPQAFGVNIVGMLWGSLKFVIVVARDVADTFETIAQTFGSIGQSLPLLEATTRIYAQSRIQVLIGPLTEIYASIMFLALSLLKIFGRGSLRTLGQAAWSSLRDDIDESLRRLNKAGNLIERAASVEHMYATDQIGKNMSLENDRQQRFRREVRHHIRQPNEGEKSLIAPFNDAPIGLLSDHFTGRTEELDHVRTSLHPKNNKTPARCAITGMPGLGKTQLALKYTTCTSNNQSFIFWISATTAEKIVAGFSKILDLVDHIDRDHTDQNVRMGAAQRWLEKVVSEQSWLLVLDNVNQDTVPFLRQHLPRNGQGSTLFTTRSLDVAKALVDRKFILSLEVPSQDDAVNLLFSELEESNHGDHSTNLEQAQELVKSIGRLPLAINHVASFANQNCKSLSATLDLYQGQRKTDILKWENRLSNYEQASVMAVFAAKFDELETSSPVTSILFQILCFFDPESIPIDMIEQGAEAVRTSFAHKGSIAELSGADKPSAPSPPIPSKPRLRDRLRARVGRGSAGKPNEPHVSSSEEVGSDTMDEESIPMLTYWDSCRIKILHLLEDPVELAKALQRLSEASLLVHRSSKSLRIHDLVQSMARHNKRESELYLVCFQLSVRVVNGAFNKCSELTFPESWPRHEEILPHYQALAISSNDIEEHWKLNLHVAGIEASKYLSLRGRWKEAAQVLMKVIEIRETHFGTNELWYLICLEMLASIRNNQCKFVEAESLLKRAVRGFKETVGVDGLKTLQAMRHLAFIYQVQGRDEEASDLLDHVLRFTERVFGPEHSETMGTVLERARLLKFQSRYAEAGPLFERVLIGLTKTLGANHIETLWTMSEFGDMKHRQGRLEEADSLISNSLAGFIVTAGREHYTTIWVRLSLGDLRLAQERYQDAQFHYKAALDSKEDVIGLWHERTVITRLTLWEFVLDRDLHCEEDEELCRRALKSLEEEHGLTNEFASRTAVVLLNILDSRGKNEEEEGLARRWFGAYEEKYGLAHSDMKTKALYFAAVLHRHGRTEEEQALLERCRIAGFTPESWRKEWEEAHRKEEGGREVESDSKPPVSDNTEEGAPCMCLL